MLLKKEWKPVVEEGQSGGITKEQMTKDTPHGVAMQSRQQTNMRRAVETTKTHRKKRNIRERENKLLRTTATSVSPYTLESSSKLTAPTASTSTSTSTSMAPHSRPTTPKQKSMWHWRSLPILMPLLLLLVQAPNVINALEQPGGHSASTAHIITVKYSQPFGEGNNAENSFRPIIPKDINLDFISRNVFTNAGQYRVFEPVESDLRATVALRKDDGNDDGDKVESMVGSGSHLDVVSGPKLQTAPLASSARNNAKSKQIPYDSVSPPTSTARPSAGSQTSPLASDIKGLESLLAEYVDNFFNRAEYQPKPELIMALQQNYTAMRQQYERSVRPRLPQVPKMSRPVRQAVTKRSNNELSLSIPRAFESGRLLFFAGLKKVMWPIYMGLQILKSLMFALLLPTLIGSFGKLLGKGLTTGSAPLFIRPMDEPQDLDFKDNNFSFDDDSNKFSLMNDGAAGAGVKDNGYAYNQAEASQTHNQYAFNAASLNQQALSRYGMNERQQLMQDSYLSALQSLGAASFKNSIGLSGSSTGGGGLAAPMRQKPAAPANMNTFTQFQKVPASSLLLSNYDPFYSPLLSRLDSVFAQLKLNSDDEACREKLICLMYANPAKYAPYSNLVSAQLSRELNELRKPTSDNPDILRFFKYMRAAKDGQDGIDCEESFEKCKEFKDFENPAMVSTYHDINKLVQARKLT